MSASAASLSSSDEIITAPPGVVARARTRAAGLALSVAGVFALIAVFSHDPMDPSLNAATAGPAANLLGGPGAVAADLILQTLGWSGAAAALALIAWGLILVVRGPRRRGVWLGLFRLTAGALGVTGFAMAVSALPMPVGWPGSAGFWATACWRCSPG